MSVLDRFRLNGKVALVTGASSGLGAGFAVGLAEAGADLALGARRVELIQAVAAEVETMGARAVVSRTDVSDPDECAALVEAAMSAFGHVDILINNAGINHPAPGTREEPDAFRQVIDVNLNGTFWMSQACARRMVAGSTIINVASALAFTTDHGMPQASYCSSKAGVIGLTRELAQQWGGRKGIRVNALVPGYFPSEMTARMDSAYLDSIIDRRVPMKRSGRVDELVAALVFLASDASSYMNGTALTVDGGLLTG